MPSLTEKLRRPRVSASFAVQKARIAVNWYTRCQGSMAACLHFVRGEARLMVGEESIRWNGSFPGKPPSVCRSARSGRSTRHSETGHRRSPPDRMRNDKRSRVCQSPGCVAGDSQEFRRTAQRGVRGQGSRRPMRDGLREGWAPRFVTSGPGRKTRPKSARGRVCTQRGAGCKPAAG